MKFTGTNVLVTGASHNEPTYVEPPISIPFQGLNPASGSFFSNKYMAK